MKEIPKGFTLRSGTMPSVIPAAVRRALDVLEKLPFKEIINTKELAARIGVVTDTLRGGHSADEALKENRFTYRGNVLWGSKKTIAELRRQMNAEKD